MSTLAFVVLAMAVAILAVAVSISFFLYLYGEFKRQKEFSKASSEFDKINEELKEWKKKIADALHFLKGSSWRDSSGKEQFVKTLYEEKIPDYLWYAIGFNRATGEEFLEICRFFWNRDDAEFGNFEVHVSCHKEIGKALRIRDAKRFAAEITFGGKKCPLYQIGHSMFGDETVGCVSFINFHGKSKDRGKKLNIERIG